MNGGAQVAAPRAGLAMPRRTARPARTDGKRARVLVVDDHEMNVELLEITLNRLGYDVSTAASGDSALRVVEEEEPDIVLLDVVMPGISGLDVLRTIRGRPETADLPVILVSGLGDTEHIVDGLRLGANDYVTKPLDMPVLQARLATQAALKSARDDLKRTAELLAAELDRKARELRVAGHVQRSLLPSVPPASDDLAVAWCYEPATEVGGDLFDVIRLPDRRMLLFVADAMGHGVQAALVASSLKATLAIHVEDSADDLPGLMECLDETISGLFDDRFVTAAVCLVDAAAREIHYASAGHPPILVSTGGRVIELPAGGLPLGMSLGGRYYGGSLDIEPGASILLYSDGITEALGPPGAQFGQARLIEALSTGDLGDPEQVVRSLREILDDFRGPVPLDDDLTLLAARLL